MPLATVYGVTLLGSRPASPGSGQSAADVHGPIDGAADSLGSELSGLSVTPPLVAAIV
jgi:hypothetical protein